MPLLFLDSMNDDPVSKQKGIAAPLTRTAAGAASGTALNKVGTGDRPGLEHTPTNASVASTSRLTPVISNDTDGRILYPFKIKHLGNEVYTLYATSDKSRQEWCQKIIEAKTRHAKQLFTNNAEPFKLRAMADSAFAYDSVAALAKLQGYTIRGTPLDRAIRDIERIYGPGRGPPPVCRAQVNCATGFTAFGK